MQEFYDMIEAKIREGGYEGEIDGYEIYNEISDEIDEKEPGTYIFMSKKTDDIFYEYKVEVMEEEFNLSYLDIHDKDKVIHVNFD
jgi:hypothetical protein